MYNNNPDYLDFDEVITGDGSQFVLLESGDYDFSVTKVTKGESKAGAPMVTLNCRIEAEEGVQDIPARFVLSKSAMWKIAEIHRCVGLKKAGEDVRMQWNKMEGLTGMCRVVKVKNSPDAKNPQGFHNDIDKFYDKKEEEAKPAVKPAPRFKS